MVQQSVALVDRVYSALGRVLMLPWLPRTYNAKQCWLQAATLWVHGLTKGMGAESLCPLTFDLKACTISCFVNSTARSAISAISKWSLAVAALMSNAGTISATLPSGGRRASMEDAEPEGWLAVPAGVESSRARAELSSMSTSNKPISGVRACGKGHRGCAVKHGLHCGTFRYVGYVMNGRSQGSSLQGGVRVPVWLTRIKVVFRRARRLLMR